METQRMDPELRETLRTILDQASSAATSARSADSKVDEAILRVGRLERHVFGSNPPSDSDKPAQVIKRVSSAEGDVDDLIGRVVNMGARLEKVERLNIAQSNAMGITDDAKKNGVGFFLRSREGRNFVLRVLTLLTVIYGAREASTAASMKHPTHAEAKP